jgi:hypothetical protein
MALNLMAAVGEVHVLEKRIVPNGRRDRNELELGDHELDRFVFGLLHVRGRYVENFRSPGARPIDVRGYLVIGNSDDSGNLKGLLRKYGRRCCDSQGLLQGR